MATKTEIYERIAKHGRKLLAIFPNATERDPVKLCKKLRRIELSASNIGLELCNSHDMSEGEQESRIESALNKVDALIGFRALSIPVFVNLDPRGYALKINDEWMKANAADLHEDWGGYGIIAPDLSEEF